MNNRYAVLSAVFMGLPDGFISLTPDLIGFQQQDMICSPANTEKVIFHNSPWGQVTLRLSVRNIFAI
jgi:hypothetical protein